MVSARKDLDFALFIFVLLSARIVLAIETSFQAESKQTNYKHAALFVFGDSIYDVGNNNFLNVSDDYKANFPPYGETFFKFPTGRTSDGRLIPDLIAHHADLPYWKPYLAGNQNFSNGANFASAAASVLTGSTPTLDLETQLSYFKEVAGLLRQELGDAEAENVLKNAIYLSSLGGMDYWILYKDNANSKLSQKLDYVNIVIGNITDAVKEIYALGGRRFAFQNVGPMGCSPDSKEKFNLTKDECFGEIEDLIRLHNQALVTAAAELTSQLPGYKYLVFDYFTALEDRIFNPTKYGFKEADIACCGSGIYRAQDCGIGQYYELCSNPNEYLYFDGDHLTEHGYSQIAELLWNGDKNVTAPYNMRQLFELEVDEILNFSEYGVSADE